MESPRTPADRIRWLARWVTRLESLELRLFGRSGISVLRRRPVLLLETIGRRTGRRRRTPVTYTVLDGGDLLIGGGAGGMTRVDWVANLRRLDEAHVWLRRRRQRVSVRELAGAERDEAYDLVRGLYPEIERYPAVSGRPIPYFRLQPAPG